MKQDRGRRTRARIAGAALEVLRESGSAGLTMRRVASRTGLSLSNVQYHFKSREDLLVGITDHHLALCRDAMERGLERAGAITLRSILRVSLCDDAVRETAPAFRELFALARFEPSVAERVNQHYADGLEALVGLLAEESSASKARRREVATLLATSIEGAYLLSDVTPVSAARLAKRLEETARWLLEKP